MIKSHKNQSIKQQETWHIKNFYSMSFSIHVIWFIAREKKHERGTQNKMFYKSVSAENISDYDFWFDRMWKPKPKSISRINPMLLRYLFLSFDFIVRLMIFLDVFSIFFCMSGIKWISQFNDFNQKKL